MVSQSVSSVAQSCPTLCDPMNCSMPGLPVHHQLPEFTQTHVHRVGDSIQPSHPVIPFSCPQSLPASESFPMSQLFTWGGQSTGVSALASFLPKNTQDWAPLGNGRYMLSGNFLSPYFMFPNRGTTIRVTHLPSSPRGGVPYWIGEFKTRR